MYSVLLERGAERDLKRLPDRVHDRVIKAIRALGTTRGLPDPENWEARTLTGESELEIIG